MPIEGSSNLFSTWVITYDTAMQHVFALLLLQMAAGLCTAVSLLPHSEHALLHFVASHTFSAKSQAQLAYCFHRQKYTEEEDTQAAEEFVSEDKEEEPTVKRRSKPKFMF